MYLIMAFKAEMCNVFYTKAKICGSRFSYFSFYEY